MPTPSYVCRFCSKRHEFTATDIATAKDEAAKYGDDYSRLSDGRLLDAFGREICPACCGEALPVTVEV